MSPSIAPLPGFRRHQQVHAVTAAEALFQYPVNPAAEPQRQWLEIEGPGRSLHLSRKGSPDFFSFFHLAQSLLEDGLSDREKALRIYRFAGRHFYGASSPGWGNTEMTRFINAIGSSYCWGQADFQILLYRAAGLRARHPVLKGHSSVEVWIDGKWRMMDAYMRLVVPAPDLNGFATGEELSRQLALFDAARDPSETKAAKDYWSGYGAGGVYQPHEDNHAMLLHLRRRESVRFDLDRREAWGIASHEVRDFCNGDWKWSPHLDAPHLEKETVHVSNVEAGEDGLRAADPHRSSSLVYRIHSPWPLLGGQVRWQWNAGQSATLQYLDPQSCQWVEVGSGDDAKTVVDAGGVLSASRLPSGTDMHMRPIEKEVVHERVFRLSWTGPACLETLDFQFLLQAHRPSIPLQSAGVNDWTLLAEAPGTTIRHGWTEYPDLKVSTLRPRCGETVEIRGLVHFEGETPLENVPVCLRQKGQSGILAEGRIERLCRERPAEVVLSWKAEGRGDRWDRIAKKHTAYVQTDLELWVGKDDMASTGSLSPIAEATLVVLSPKAPRVDPLLVRRESVGEDSFRLRAAVVHPWPLSGFGESDSLYLQEVTCEAVLQLYRGHPREGDKEGQPQRTPPILASEFEIVEWCLPKELEQEDLWIVMEAPGFEGPDSVLQVPGDSKK